MTQFKLFQIAHILKYAWYYFTYLIFELCDNLCRYVLPANYVTSSVLVLLLNGPKIAQFTCAVGWEVLVRAPDDGCQHPKHEELPTEI
jgi:hypothetical protein